MSNEIVVGRSEVFSENLNIKRMYISKFKVIFKCESHYLDLSWIKLFKILLTGYLYKSLIVLFSFLCGYIINLYSSTVHYL